LDLKAKPQQVNNANYSCFFEQVFNDPGFYVVLTIYSSTSPICRLENSALLKIRLTENLLKYQCVYTGAFAPLAILMLQCPSGACFCFPQVCACNTVTSIIRNNSLYLWLNSRDWKA